MPTPHQRPWRRGSQFGLGPRRPLDREQRARFRWLLRSHARGGRLSPKAEWVGNALLKRLGQDGQCDPSHDTLAGDAGCSSRTVRRACAAMRVLGILRWTCRLVRAGWRTEQTSNAYTLFPTAAAPTVMLQPCGGHPGRETRQEEIHPVLQLAPEVVAAAQAALARRRAAIESRLMNMVMAGGAAR